MSHYAKYYKCALQVNPYCYSAYRGEEIRDENQYNAEILEKCQNNKIDIIGLANHGDIDSSENLRSYLEEHGITVFPGFEIMSAEKIHMVCLFSNNKTSNELNRYIGALGLPSSCTGNETSSKPCLEIAAQVQQLGGFWYAAHITGENGILKLGKMQNVWKSERLIAAQIPNSRENIDPKFKNIIQNTDPAYKRERLPALINACDIDKPSDLDKDTSVTLVKMSNLSFDSFTEAFKDPESRIRLQSELENTHRSSINKVSIVGGYLDGFEIDFSSDLNTLIGGRGTGKSTIINLIRYALELNPVESDREKEFNSLIDANLGSNGRIELVVTSYALHGKQYRIIRRYKQPSVVEDMTGHMVSFQLNDILPQVEIYGQNEIVDAVKSPELIRKVIQRLIKPDEAIQQELEHCYSALHDNSQKLKALSDESDTLRNSIANLPFLKSRFKLYEDAGVESKLPTLRRYIDEEMQFENFNSIIKTQTAPDWPVIKLPSHTTELAALNDLAREFNSKINALSLNYQETALWLSESFSAIYTAWKTSRNSYNDEIKSSLKNVDAIQDKTSQEIVNEFSTLLKEIKRAEPAEVQLQEKEAKITALRNERANLIESCRKAWDEYTRCINKQLKKINKQFDGKLKISVRFRQDKRPLLQQLKKINGIGDKAIQGIELYEDFDTFTFVNDIAKGAEHFRQTYSLTQSASEKIIDSVKFHERCAIEEMRLADIFQIELFVNKQYKPMEKLSKGQQCTAILHILLVDNKDPLLIDQPEDNLDNSFIADSLISSIRLNKTKRQYIFATHNANIPVFGDAELIAVMEEVDGMGRICAGGIGSIDNPTVQDNVITILEGGKDAFIMREQKYGL